MFSGLEPQLEGDDPLILSEKRGASYIGFFFFFFPSGMFY